MADWHLTPSYILIEMTEELLALMFQMRNERIRAMNQPVEDKDQPVKYNRVSDTEFFAMNNVTVGQA